MSEQKSGLMRKGDFNHELGKASIESNDLEERVKQFLEMGPTNITDIKELVNDLWTEIESMKAGALEELPY